MYVYQRSTAAIVLYSFIILHTLTGVIVMQSADDVKDLMTQIFTTDAYNYRVRPATDQSVETLVYLDYILTGIIEFDEQEGSLTTSGYFDILWNDNYLTWDSTNYGGLDLLFVPQDDIWKPDIALQNSYSSFAGLGSKFTSAKVDNTGSVYWNPFAVLKSTCGVDITYFPFDTQTCTLKFIAWSYTKSEVYVEPGTKGIVLDQYQPNSGWDLIGTSYKVEIESDESAVHFTLKLKRKPLFYIMNIVIPVIFLSALSACVFILPASSGERAGFSVTVFLSLAVFLTIVSSTLPQNSDTTSYMSIYLMVTVGASTANVIVTLVQLRLFSRNEKDQPVPYPLVKLTQMCDIVRCKCLKKREQPEQNSISSSVNSVSPLAEKSLHGNGKFDLQDVDGLEENRANETIENVTCTWAEVVNALDLIFFLFFSLFAVISTSTIYGIAAAGH